MRRETPHNERGVCSSPVDRVNTATLIRTAHARPSPKQYISAPVRWPQQRLAGVRCPPVGLLPPFLSGKSAPTPQTATQPDHPTTHPRIQIIFQTHALRIREPRDCKQVEVVILFIITNITMYTPYYVYIIFLGTRVRSIISILYAEYTRET